MMNIKLLAFVIPPSIYQEDLHDKYDATYATL